MARYIDADAVCDKCPIPKGKYNCQLCDVGDAPTADVVEVKHGRWIIGEDEAEYEYGVCSVCDHREWDAFAYGRDRVPNYCPNCGARMDGGETDAKTESTV